MVKAAQNKTSYIFFRIQETQLADTNSIDVEDCWDHSEFGHIAMQSVGRSGGILSLWDARSYNVAEISSLDISSSTGQKKAR